MATTTDHLGITLVEQSQAQKEVTVNEALALIDSLLNTGIIDRGVDTPPLSPSSGDLYIVGNNPTGDWTGHANHLAWYNQVWRFITPNEGLTLWVNDENALYTWDGSVWLKVVTGSAIGDGDNIASDYASDTDITDASNGDDKLNITDATLISIGGTIAEGDVVELQISRQFTGSDTINGTV